MFITFYYALKKVHRQINVGNLALSILINEMDNVNHIYFTELWIAMK